MKKLTIGFSKPRAWNKQILSFFIRKVDGVSFSHSYIKIENDKLENDLYYHATGSKVQFMGKKLFLKLNIPVKEYEFKIKSKTFYKTLDFAIERVGEKYSIIQLVGMLIMKIYGFFGKKINNPFTKKGYICTELVGELLKEVYGKKIEKDLGSLTLKDIENILHEN